MSVERPERHVPGFSGDFEYQTVGEAKAGPLSKAFDGGGNCVRILDCQVLVVEEHLDGRCDLLRTAIVDRREDPRGFGEHEVRDPGSSLDERLRRRHLPGLVSRDEPDEDVRVNGSHGVS